MASRRNKEDEYRELKRDAKRQGIEINSRKYNPLTVVDVPTEHKDKFAIIQSLGRTSYANFGFLPDGDTPNKPWQLDIKKRALQLMHFAERCRKENRNESGWRYDIEQRLFERFDIEVACKRCRKRLWRSEIEVDPNSSNSRTNSLEARQKKRQTCTCNPNDRIDDYSALDPGLSDLFSARMEEPCCDPDSSMSGPTKRPDRIHGLQRTKNFDILLQSPYAHDDSPRRPERLVEQVVRTTLNPDNGGSPLLFPFLILEAKRERGADNFEQMETQTCFPIKHALQLQYDLIKTRGNAMDTAGGPLVWFLANRGEDWRIYSGHVEDSVGKPKYMINYLWGGSITGIDEILQLILIIDFIVDWARDAFRPNILRQLRTLSTTNCNESMTVIFDPDVYSLHGEVQPWIEGQGSDLEEFLEELSPDLVSESPVDDICDPLARFKTIHGVVKDARQIQSRLRGLIITRDNLDTILQSFENPNNATRFVRSVISSLYGHCATLDSEDVLDAVEEQWTGTRGNRTPHLGQKPSVHVLFRISFYVDPVWELVRELTYLAATDDARPLLIERARFRHGTKRYHFCPPTCTEAVLLDAFRGLRRNSVRHDLVSSLRRRTYMVDFRESQNTIMVEYDDDFVERKESKAIVKQDEDKSAGSQMQRIVHEVYEKHRIGSREPSEPFLRASSRVDSESRALWRGWKPGDSLPYRDQHLEKILVYSDVPDARYLPDGSRQKYCLYILHGQTDQLTEFSVASKLIWTLFKDEIYSTVRKAKVPRNNRNCQDNRNRYWFSMGSEETQNILKISRDCLRQDVFSWIKAIAGTDSLESVELERIVKTWYVSKAATRALEESGVCTIFACSSRA